MPMSHYIVQAQTLLCKEVFAYVDKMTNEAFAQLARENSKIRGCAASHFMYQGAIYPDHSQGGTYAMLHVTLYDTFDEIVRQRKDSGREEIKNFFSAVLNISANGIVLDALLPTILVNSLKKEFDEPIYKIINQGSPDHWVSIETTRTNIIAIKHHYAKTIERLREILMEKFLLQGDL